MILFAPRKPSFLGTGMFLPFFRAVETVDEVTGERAMVLEIDVFAVAAMGLAIFIGVDLPYHAFKHFICK